MASNREGRLKRAAQYVRTEPGLLRNVVAITIVVVLGMGVGGTVLSQQRFTPPWEQSRQVWATFTEAASVAPGLGQDVLINGIQVGQIQDTRIDNQGRALLLLTVRKNDYDRPIYDNAQVVMRPTTPLNAMYIEMNPGSPPGNEVPDYGVLPAANSISPRQIDSALAHLDENTRDAAAEVLSQADVALARIPQDLPGGVDALAGFTRELQPIAEQLDVRRDKVEQLVTSLGQVAQAVGGNDVRLTNLANSLQTTLGAVAQQNEALRESFNRLPGVTTQLRESTAAVSGLTTQLDPTLDNILEASETLPDSLSGLTQTVDTLDTTVDRLRPVAQKLRPTAADLRPFVDDLNRTLPDLKTIVSQLNPVTERLLPYLPDLKAFTYQTRSVTDLGDGLERNSLRALAQGGICTVPSGQLPGFPPPPLAGTPFGDLLGEIAPGNPLCNGVPGNPELNVPKFQSFDQKKDERKDEYRGDKPEERKDERADNQGPEDRPEGENRPEDRPEGEVRPAADTREGN